MYKLIATAALVACTMSATTVSAQGNPLEDDGWKDLCELVWGPNYGC